MNSQCTFSISTLRFDENYSPSTASRATTNFANLARGEKREQNLRNVLSMINNRFNDLAHWDNAGRDRYRLELDIVSVDLNLDSEQDNASFPIIEMLNIAVLDQRTGRRIDGIVGNNFSSYIRDHDFSVRLPQFLANNSNNSNQSLPDDFGVLHGKVFKRFLESDAYRQAFSQAPVICLSVSTSRSYQRLTNEHPTLGIEYQQDEYSLTDEYFSLMGLKVRYFMPPGALAPLAFYHQGDLLNSYTPLALASTIATMESFQKIYRPEIYNANTAAGEIYRPSLEHGDYSLTNVSYDRAERSKLAITQGQFTETHLLQPYGAVLTQWAA